MNSRRIQFNGRKTISLVLAALILALAAAPALAWEDEEGHTFQTSPQHQSVVQLNGDKDSSNQDTSVRLASPARPSFQLRPSLARAE
jgi:hypothetical protein